MLSSSSSRDSWTSRGQEREESGQVGPSWGRTVDGWWPGEHGEGWACKSLCLETRFPISRPISKQIY